MPPGAAAVAPWLCRGVGDRLDLRVHIMLGQERAAGEALQLDLESFSLFICLKEF